MEDIYCAPYTFLGISLFDGTIPSLVIGICSLITMVGLVRHEPRPYTAIIFIGAFCLFCVGAASYTAKLETTFFLVAISFVVLLEVLIRRMRAHIVTALCSLLAAGAYWYFTLSLVIAGGMRPAVL